MKKIILASLVLFTTTSISFAGSIYSMNKMQAKNTLNDKTITTISAITLDGKVIADSFTGYFSNDGKVMGKLANKADGSPQTDNGMWKVNNKGMVCITWEHWNNAKEKCVNFYKLSNAILITNGDKGFESLILNDQIQTGNQLSQ